MKVVEQETWSWMLLAEGGADGAEHYLSVVCGSVALYDIDFALTAEEAAQYRREGRASIEKLAAAVAYSPRSFQPRHLPDFHARPEVKAAIEAWNAAAKAAKGG